MPHHPPHHVLLALAIAVLAPAACIAAEAPSAPAETAPADDAIFGTKTELTVGAGATWGARYPGARERQWIPNPVLSVQRGILFADTLRGAGLQYQSASGFYVSQSIWYDLGRLDRDSNWRPGANRLAGLGDVAGTVTSHTIVAQQATPWLLASAELEAALRDSARRNRYRLGLEFTPLKTAADTVTVDLDAWWGDARYNDAYFGVTPQQAARTRFATFRPGAGAYAQMPAASWEHRFGGHWASTLQLMETHYAGKVARSPLVAQRTSASLTAAIAYTF